MAAITAGVVVAGATAYSANQARKGAKEANKPKNATTDQTSTTSWDPRYNVDPHVQSILSESERLYNQSISGSSGSGKAKGGSGGGGGNFGGYTAAQLQADPSLVGKLGSKAQAKWAAAQGGGAPTGPKTPQSAQDFFRGAGNLGLDIDKDPLYGQASDFLGGMLGTGQSSEEALDYNPVAKDLNERLKGSSLDESDTLLREFLGIGEGGSYSSSGSSRSGGNPAAAAAGRVAYRGPAISWAGNTPSGSAVPDTSKGGGQFNDELAKIFDPARLDPASDPTMQPMLDAIQKEAKKGLQDSLWDLDAQIAGAGRYGSDSAAFARGAATNEFGDALNQAVSSTLFSSREANLGRVMEGLGLRNSRDVAAMADATQREGISASSGAAAGGLELQRELANRGMDLEAIQMLTQNNQFGMAQLGELAGQLSSDKFNALGGVGDLLGLKLGGGELALGAGSGMLGVRNADQQDRAFNAARKDKASMAQDEALNRYLGRVLSVAGVGGTTTNHTTGTNVVPGAGISPSGAAVGAGLGTAGQLAGLYGMFSGLNSGAKPPAQQPGNFSYGYGPNGPSW
jgi:hypothetical protein